MVNDESFMSHYCDHYGGRELYGGTECHTTIWREILSSMNPANDTLMLLWLIVVIFVVKVAAAVD